MAFTDVHWFGLLFGLIIMSSNAEESQSSVTIDQVTLNVIPGSQVATGTNVTLQCQVKVSHSSSQRLVHSFRFLNNQDKVLYSKNSTDDQVEFSFSPARATHSGRYTCHVRVLEKERSSQEQELLVSGLMTPVLAVSPLVIYEGQEVNVSCQAPEEVGTLAFHLYGNGNYLRSATGSPPGVNVTVKLSEVGKVRLHCKMVLLTNYQAGESNISNAIIVTVRALEITPRITFDPPSNVIEGDMMRVTCTIPNKDGLRSVWQRLQLFLTKDGRVLKQTQRTESCGVTLRTVAADSGTYVCKAEIGNLQKATSGVASVAELFSTPELQVRPPRVFEGDNFTVMCIVATVSNRITPSLITYRLFRNQRELQRGQQYMAVAGSAHDGGYFCQATAKEISKNSTESLVKARALPSIPLISVENGVILGRPFQVQCRIDRGSLPVVYTLTRAQRVLETKQVHGLSASFNVSAVRRRSEVEEFRCQAQNDVTRPRAISQPLRASITEPISMATLMVEPFGGGITEGSTLKLTCSAPQGTPPLTFTFYYNLPGAPASQRKQLLQTLEPSSNQASHTVHDIHRGQGGQYQCHAANRANDRNSSAVLIHVKLAPWKVALITVCAILLVAGIGVVLLILIKRGSNSRKNSQRGGELSVKPAKNKSNDPQRVSLVLEEQPPPNATPGMLGRSVWSEHISGSGSDSDSQSEEESSGHVQVQYPQVITPRSPPPPPPPPQADKPTVIPVEVEQWEGEIHENETEPLSNGTDTEHYEIHTTAEDSPTQPEGASLEYAQLNHNEGEPE